MAAIGQDFEIYAGNSADINVTVRTSPDDQPKDLGLCQIAWRAISQVTCDLAIEKTTPSGVEVSATQVGVFRIKLSSAETKAIKPGRYDHVATVTDAEGNTCTVTVGVMTVKTV